MVTVQDFLLGCAGGYPIEQNTLNYISVKKGQTLDTDISMLSTAERDLLEIEMLRFLLRAPGMTAAVQDTNGTWSHKEGAVQMNSTEKKFLAKRLHELEDIYGMCSSGIRIHNRGMKIC